MPTRLALHVAAAALGQRLLPPRQCGGNAPSHDVNLSGAGGGAEGNARTGR
mgnify:CR=1 FL=1